MLKGTLCLEKQYLFAYFLVFKHRNNVTGKVVGSLGFSEVCVSKQDLSLLARM